MHCVVMEEKGAWSLAKMKSWLTDYIQRHQPSVNSTDASGMVVLAWKPPMTGLSAGIIELWISKTESEDQDMRWLRFGMLSPRIVDKRIW